MRVEKKASIIFKYEKYPKILWQKYLRGCRKGSQGRYYTLTILKK